MLSGYLELKQASFSKQIVLSNTISGNGKVQDWHFKRHKIISKSYSRTFDIQILCLLFRPMLFFQFIELLSPIFIPEFI